MSFTIPRDNLDQADKPPTAKKTVKHENPKNLVVGLELVRGLACLEVVGSHMLWADPVLQRVPWFLEIFRWGYQAVIVFFVLSGYVIARAQMRKNRTPWDYLYARIERIAPLYLIALIFSVVVSLFLSKPVTLEAIVGHLFFMQAMPNEISSIKIQSNPALWSLSHEAWFYLFYALILSECTILYKRKLITWALISLICCSMLHWINMKWGLAEHPMWILALSPIWLLGLLIASFRDGIPYTLAQAVAFTMLIPLIDACRWGHGVNDPVMSLACGLAVSPLLVVLSSPKKSKGKWITWLIIGLVYMLFTIYAQKKGAEGIHAFNTSFIVVAFSVTALMVLCENVIPRIADWPETLTKTILIVGQMSYAIYIFHQPIIRLASSEFNMNDHSAYWVLVLFFIFLVAGIMEFVIHPYLKQCLKTLVHSCFCFRRGTSNGGCS